MKIEVKAIVRNMEKGKPTLVIVDGTEFVPREYKAVQPTRQKRKYRRVKKNDDVYYDKKYSVHIKQHHIDKVKQAILYVEKWWIPDFKHIQRFTKIAAAKLQRILHYMVSQKMIRRVNKKVAEEDGIGILTGKQKWTFVYELVGNTMDTTTTVS